MWRQGVSLVGDACERRVVTVRPSDRLRDVAERMFREGVGCVVVERAGRPLAVLTDRDLALEALCDDVDAAEACAEDVMGRIPITIFEGSPLSAAAEMIGVARVRRLPVVGADGRLVGLLSADELLLHTAGWLSRICGVIQEQSSAHAQGEPSHACD